MDGVKTGVKTVDRITAVPALLVGLAGSAAVLYGALFWLPYHLQGGRFHSTGIILLASMPALLSLSWAPLAIRRLNPRARTARLLGYDLSLAGGTAILAVPFLMSPVRLAVLLPLVAYLVLIAADLAGCLGRPQAEGG
ncbi:hypothetical protein DYI95_009185 [Thermaerobacter sp. PB12/4term]|uniref:hypothetical protein n=1 Tax=Thermaerobacter sp. PB12/4term TaxID=2293838 RepID=UPI000E3279A0|nr:hypothetical protein [Thermaerobacter sp. PB12/4term]QIA27662.1 hypothetical protein DYI95_009185 [Thermaerobacter sp. PB12/4term]